jgi:hypothetical protein
MTETQSMEGWNRVDEASQRRGSNDNTWHMESRYKRRSKQMGVGSPVSSSGLTLSYIACHQASCLGFFLFVLVATYFGDYFSAIYGSVVAVSSFLSDYWCFGTSLFRTLIVGVFPHAA